MSDYDTFSKRKILFDLILHEADRLSSRTNWFLIFNATLLAAFSATIKNDVQFIILLLGIAINWIWLTTSLYQKWAIDQIGRRLKGYFTENDGTVNELNSLYEERSDEMPWYYRWASATACYTLITPLICFLVWLSLLLPTDLNSVLSFVWRFDLLSHFSGFALHVILLIAFVVVISLPAYLWKGDGSRKKNDVVAKICKIDRRIKRLQERRNKLNGF